MRPALLLLLVAGCPPPLMPVMGPRTQPIVRPATVVNASFTRTWNAVIDHFAEQNMSIRVLDRTSGWVATQTLRVGNPKRALAWADCGAVDKSRAIYTGEDTMDKVPIVAIAAEQAVYDVVVHGDSTQSTVRVAIHWTSTYRISEAAPLTPIDCVTKGVWEADFETTVKQAAEQR